MVKLVGGIIVVETDATMAIIASSTVSDARFSIFVEAEKVEGLSESCSELVLKVAWSKVEEGRGRFRG
jgi:hypothetical protein